MGTHDPTDDGRHLTDATTAVELIEEQTEQRIRRVWHDGRWFFSVIDVIAVLTDSPRPRKYWSDMKQRIQDEGFRELLTNCRQLKLPLSDGRFYSTDCADFATLVALIHALPALHRRLSRATLDKHLDSYTCTCGIYAILNTITHERYIGSSNDMAARFAQHKALLRRGKHHSLPLQEAWNTYGEDAFVFVVLEALSDTDQLEVVEQQYLDAERPHYNGASVAHNQLALKPIAEERIQRLLLHLYDLHCSSFSAPSPLLGMLREALRYGVVKPGRNFQTLLAAESSGIETWEAFGSFMQQRDQAQ